MAKKILVTGGSGFIGSEVCRLAVEQGHDVVSVSRSGQPDIDAPWTEKVRWVAANILEPELWREHLEGCDAVIHCVGTRRDDPRTGMTLERLNDDATEMVAWEAEHAGVPRFIFLSALSRMPGRSGRFIEAKRRAEAMLRGRGIHESILRPAYVYGPGRPTSVVVAGALNVASKVPGLSDRVESMRPLHVDQVAIAAVRAATEPGYEGIISIDNIEYLAGDQWKPGADESEEHPIRKAAPFVAGGLLAIVGVGLAWLLVRRYRDD